MRPVTVVEGQYNSSAPVFRVPPFQPIVQRNDTVRRKFAKQQPKIFFTDCVSALAADIVQAKNHRIGYWLNRYRLLFRFTRGIHREAKQNQEK